MQKEKLTIDNINQDLRNETKERLKELVELGFVFLCVLPLVLFGCKSLNTLYLVLIWFLCCCGEVAILVMIVKKIRIVAILHKSLKNEKNIVIDKLISAQTKEKWHGRYLATYYYLHFSQYGEFQIPDENYKWSAMFLASMYNRAKSGDEFYLVLSKQHTGKILYAYNTKTFELENKPVCEETKDEL